MGLEGRKKEGSQASSAHSSCGAPLALSQGLTIVSRAQDSLTPGVVGKWYAGSCLTTGFLGKVFICSICQYPWCYYSHHG